MSETPHDALFRFAFTQPAVAADHFRSHLPRQLVAAARWHTMQLQPGSFVDQDLKQVHSDVLYRVELADGPSLWLYVLFEHQSTVDPMMAWRVLRYMVRIWDRVLDERAGTARGLPFVLPMVLYNGERRWTVAEAFEALFPLDRIAEAVRAPLLERVPRFRYVLQDLSVLPDDALRGMVLREAVLLAFKHARTATWWTLRAWLDLLLRVAAEPDGLHAVEALWRYVLTVASGPPPEEVRAYLVARLTPEGQRLIMGYGEQLIEQGRQEGRQEGEARLLLMLLRHRFGELADDVVARIEAATEAEIEVWVKRAVDAANLEAVLA
jgi:hypothetical protein